jgi:DNA-binding transcriptional MerR regulator
MNPKRSDLLTIKLFSTNTQLSLKALRLYDQLGILKPLYTDLASGYRYYHVDQIHTARLVRMMRLMDMPLATIRQVLEASPDEAERLILAYWEDMQRRVVLAGHVVQTLIHSLKGEVVPMSLEVHVKAVDTQPVLSVTHHVKVNQLEDTIRASVKQLHELAKTKGVTVGVPFGLYHGAIDHESDGPIEVCLPTEKLIQDVNGNFQARELAGGKVAAVELHGAACAFPEILKGYDALIDWMRQNGYQQSESPREIWHQMTDPEHVEIAWMFKEA